MAEDGASMFLTEYSPRVDRARIQPSPQWSSEALALEPWLTLQSSSIDQNVREESVAGRYSVG